MQKEIKNKLGNILGDIKGLDKLINSSDGKKIVNSLSDAEKENLINKFMNMDSEKIKEKLKSTDFSKLSGQSIGDILKKMR